MFNISVKIAKSNFLNIYKLFIYNHYLKDNQWLGQLLLGEGVLVW